MVEFSRREELVQYLELLGDRELQEKIWINHQFPPGVEHDTLMFGVLFFDDTNLSDPKLGRKHIGHLLKDEKEFLLIFEMTQVIDKVFEEVGIGRTDQEYMNHPLWDIVVQKAKKAYAFLTK